MTKGVKNDIAKRHISILRKNTGASAEIGKKTVRGTVEIPTPMVQSHHYYQYLNPS